MKTAVMVIAHAPLASALCEAAAHVLSGQHEQLACMDIIADDDIEQSVATGLKQIEALSKDHGVLILTDCFGATPSNIAKRIADADKRHALVAGVNLPMLIRVLNYQNENAHELSKIAVEGGIKGTLAISTI